MPELPRERRFNAMKHGCCATTPVLPGEDPELWQETEAHWFTAYDPQTPVSHALVAEAALAFWHMARTRRKFHEAEWGLSAKNALEWNEADHQTYSRFLRYKTAAERAFSSAFKNLEYLRRARRLEAESQERFQRQLATLEFRYAQLALERDKFTASQQAKDSRPASSSSSSHSKKPKKDTFAVGEQWVEVTITDGLTQTAYIPTNEQLLEELEEQDTPPQMIYRRFNFPDGVPPEYAWTNRHDPNTCTVTAEGHWCPLCSVHERGGAGIQRMTFDTWKQTIEREAQSPGQHAGPTGTGNLPRPQERQGDTPFRELLDYLAWAEQQSSPPNKDAD